MSKQPCFLRLCSVLWYKFDFEKIYNVAVTQATGFGKDWPELMLKEC